MFAILHHPLIHNSTVDDKDQFQYSQGCKGYFGSDSSKSTKFGQKVANVILFGFLMGDKTGASRCRHIVQIQNGRQPVEMSIAV